MFSKPSHASTLSIWNEEIQAKTEEWTTQTEIYCGTFFWLQSFGKRNSSLANSKVYVLLYSFYFVLFWIWGQFLSTSSWGLILGGAIYRIVFFFALRVWGAYIWKGLLTWRGLFSEFYGNTLCFSPKFCIIYCFQMLNFVSSKRERELFLWNHLFPVNMYSK